MVSLGAVRPIAALRVLYEQEMSFTLSVANASAGPFVEVARQVCQVCVMNEISSKNEIAATGSDMKRVKTVLLTTAAAFVQMRVTWSSSGGPGGCTCPRYGYRGVAACVDCLLFTHVRYPFCSSQARICVIGRQTFTSSKFTLLAHCRPRKVV